MKKMMLTAVAGAMLFAPLFAERKSELYRNPAARYQISYPSDWSLKHPRQGDQSLIQIVSPDGASSVIVNPMPNVSNRPAKEFISIFENENKLQAKKRGEADLAPAVAEIGADSGHMAAYALDVPTIVTVYATSYRAYMITMRTPAAAQKGYSKQNETDAKQIINSFGIARVAKK